VNTTEPSVCGGNAAFCQITLTTCLSIVRLRSEVHCPENVTSFNCYNFNVHEPILIISGRHVTEKVNKRCFIFPPHPTSASALPGETVNPEIVSFQLNAACCFVNNKAHLKYHLVIAELPFTVETIDCMHHTWSRTGT